MRKIPTVFVRDHDTHKLTDQVEPGCEWVLAGEGQPTRKYDGTSVMLDAEGRWWARREVKAGKAMPFEYLISERDEVTGNITGWEPIENSPWAKQFRDALEHDESLWEEIVVLEGANSDVGTYELFGPKINGNPEKREVHSLIRHEDCDLLFYAPHEDIRDVVREFHRRFGYEGIVWHHPDGRMAKLKARDL